jgi:radical SAM protein with 4Fe4S-binding SPASM domain
MISLDSFNELTYNKMRIGGDVDTVRNTIIKLLNTGHNNIWVRRVITDDNKKENFIRMCKDHYGNDAHYGEHECFDRTVESKKTWKRKYCGYPSQRLVISTEGNIFPCCVDYYETMPLGNYNAARNIRELWNHDIELETLRAVLKDDKINLLPDKVACHNCTSYMAYKINEREFIEDK